MKKEEFTALGISEELAAKAEEASLKELEGYVPKEQMDTADGGRGNAGDCQQNDPYRAAYSAQ